MLNEQNMNENKWYQLAKFKLKRLKVKVREITCQGYIIIGTF